MLPMTGSCMVSSFICKRGHVVDKQQQRGLTVLCSTCTISFVVKDSKIAMKSLRWIFAALPLFSAANVRAFHPYEYGVPVDSGNRGASGGVLKPLEDRHHSTTRLWVNPHPPEDPPPMGMCDIVSTVLKLVTLSHLPLISFLLPQLFHFE